MALAPATPSAREDGDDDSKNGNDNFNCGENHLLSSLLKTQRIPRHLAMDRVASDKIRINLTIIIPVLLTDFFYLADQ